MVASERRMGERRAMFEKSFGRFLLTSTANGRTASNHELGRYGGERTASCHCPENAALRGHELGCVYKLQLLALTMVNCLPHALSVGSKFLIESFVLASLHSCSDCSSGSVIIFRYEYASYTSRYMPCKLNAAYASFCMHDVMEFH
ncbi:hypothetical protein Tco_0548649 [Tanacetum coccineum]